MKLATLLTAATLTVLAAAPAAQAPAQQQPAPNCPWMDAKLSPTQRATELVKAMTIDQKIAMVHQAQPVWAHYGAAGYIPGQADLCIPDLVLNDAGQGVGDHEINTTAFPAPIAQSASWDAQLQRRFGAALGWEAWHKGINVQLAPGMEIDRVPVNGRNFEYMSEDPFLTGKGAAAEVQGIQSNPVIATLKHYVANSQETNRMADSSDLDERTMQEIYAAPYDAAVQASHPGAVMCSYNRINGVYACENPEALKTTLKRRFGFGGFVMSDWGGTHSTIPSALAGLDMEMDLAPGHYFSTPLKDAVTNGQVPMARLDDMVFRITRAMFRAGIFEQPAAPEPQAYAADVRRPEDITLAREISEQGTVLLKNDGGVLPLGGPGKRIAVIGPAAGQQGAEQYYNGYGSGHIPEVGSKPDVVSPLQGITQRAQSAGDAVLYADGSSTLDAIAAATAADVAVVFVGASDSEGVDRPHMNLQSGSCVIGGCAPATTDQDALIAKVAAANKHTIVVLDTGGPVTMPWLPQVQGLFEAWYPGQEDGHAIASLLFGDVNPSAKLPQTFPGSERDVPASTPQQYPGGNDAQGIPHSTYSEGLLVGYRWYDAKGVQPLFPFGYGLSYTSFDVSHLVVEPSRTATAATVRLQVTNTGPRAGAEVPQLYVTDPAVSGEPPKQLKGFQKVPLAPGQTKRVSLPLDFRSFAHWSTRAHAWRVNRGCYGLAAGRSSRDLPLHATVSVGGASCADAVAFIPIVTDLTGPGGARPRCLSRRAIHIHFFGVRRSAVLRTTVFVNGRRKQSVRGHRHSIVVSLRRMPKTVARVRIELSLGTQQRAVIRRAYRTCIPTRKPKKKR